MPSLGALTALAKQLAKDRGLGTLSDRARGTLERVHRLTPATFDVIRPEIALAPIVRGDPMVATTPADFLRLAPYTDRDARVERYAAMLRNRGKKVPGFDPDDYFDRMYPTFDGFGDLPYLVYNTREGAERPFASLTGHEGRHRMMAIDEVLGNVPLSVRASTWGSEPQLPTELAKPWVLPESPATKLSPETLSDQDFIRLFLEHNPRPLKRGGLLSRR